MAFRLGNFSIDEILFGTAQNSDDDLLYVLDQLSSASIEISAESTDITDKKGNVVRTVYTSKSGTFNATNAFLHPAIMNAASGSEIQTASALSPIKNVPKIAVVAAGGTLDVSDAIEGTIRIIGLFGNGANDVPMTDSEIAAVVVGGEFTAPEEGDDKPIQYLVRYDRDITSGIKLTNDAESFPNLVKLTLFCSYVDPCSDELKPCYVLLPRFMADPSVTISLDRESQEMDFNGNLNIDYCSATKALYYIYFPEESVVVSGTTEPSI